ncbi:MAG: DUF2149 domain-containing protein [Planctomycetota bacterium]|nr:MAG: DUF2149 domain-containing protein [Planctomycetota bacterium]
MRRGRRLGPTDEDPLAGVANLFDLGIVFALGFMVSLVLYLGLPELLQREDFTLVKNPGQEDMEILRREGERLEHYRATGGEVGGQAGERLGTAWRLESGEVIYVPD